MDIPYEFVTPTFAYTVLSIVLAVGLTSVLMLFGGMFFHKLEWGDALAGIGGGLLLVVIIAGIPTTVFSFLAGGSSTEMIAALQDESEDVYGVTLTDTQARELLDFSDAEEPTAGEVIEYGTTVLPIDGAASSLTLMWVGDEWQLGNGGIVEDVVTFTELERV